ncbi:hypothetical protein THARTR1_09178 [Trichoderma harzianum]|uniref:Uncharacterized protein n=1 Tax=Trichoderma harzianum TaxID=5544 RepID=A0A2K0TXE0_TRIHA|nr:hypothetical protein THARTR1_09178 [Trichoderma harzianum]
MFLGVPSSTSMLDNATVSSVEFPNRYNGE